MANQLMNVFKVDSMTGAVNLSADAVNNKNIFVILLSASWTPDIDANIRYGSVSAHEIINCGPTPVGYSAGGQCLSAGITFTQDNTNDRASFAASNISWTSSTITARYAALVKIRNGGLNKELDNLIGYFDFGSNAQSSNGTFQIAWNANGVILLT